MFFISTVNNNTSLLDKYYTKKKDREIASIPHSESMHTFLTHPLAIAGNISFMVFSLLATIHNNRKRIKESPFKSILPILGIKNEDDLEARGGISNFLIKNPLGQFFNSSFFKTKSGINYSFIFFSLVFYATLQNKLKHLTFDKKEEKAQKYFEQDILLRNKKKKVTKEINALLEDESIEKEYQKYQRQNSKNNNNINIQYQKKKQNIEKERHNIATEKEGPYKESKKRKIEDKYKNLERDYRQKMQDQERKNKLTFLKKYVAEDSQDFLQKNKKANWIPHVLSYFSVDELLAITDDPSFPKDTRGTHHFLAHVSAETEANNNIPPEYGFDRKYTITPSKGVIKKTEIMEELEKKDTQKIHSKVKNFFIRNNNNNNNNNNKDLQKKLFKNFFTWDMTQPIDAYTQTTQEEKRKEYDLLFCPTEGKGDASQGDKS